MKRVVKAYDDIFRAIKREAPALVPFTVAAALLLGIFPPLSVYANAHIFDDGLRVAAGELEMAAFVPYLVLLGITMNLPSIIRELYIFGYVEPRMMMILNNTYKGDMFRKLERMKYEHMESEQSMEIIDKAFNRVFNSMRHLFPMYLTTSISSVVAVAGVLAAFARVRWWLLVTILLPYIVVTLLRRRNNFNIYNELEKYWRKERRYGILSSFLKSREYLYEGKLNGSSDFLIQTYRDRLNQRNREYEGYYFKHLKRYFTTGNLEKLTMIANALLILHLYLRGVCTIGTAISLILVVFTSLFQYLGGTMAVPLWSIFHVNSIEYVWKFFELSEEEHREEQEEAGAVSKSNAGDIVFEDVWFHYPGEGNPDILKGLSFHIREGERVSIVGENGEGKSTMIKLLLGLFQPDRGRITVGGRELQDYSRRELEKIFAPVFQDFNRYSITLRENIAVGDITLMDQEMEVQKAARRGMADQIAEKLPEGFDTLLGKNFEGGQDLSGGQWQRIAISRAFMGDKPILLLDEPTSQLDPMAESALYGEFHQMAQGKTTIFITHRLASTRITDRILVLSGGRVTEEGSHQQLMEQKGLYWELFEAQKKWYRNESAGEYDGGGDGQDEK